MQYWALILGASSGFGAAVCRRLARGGYNIFGVHLDRKATLPNVEKIVADIEDQGRQARFFNINAADSEARHKVVEEMARTLEPGDQALQVVLHSLAFGSLLPLVYDPSNPRRITQKQMDMTLDVMAHTLVYWVQELVQHELLAAGAHIFSMTSAGGHRVWPNYGAVSAAKAALESHTRQLALELAPLQIAVNALQAGVTDTPALRKIPGHEGMLEYAQKMNPGGRLTTPEDIAEALYHLARGPVWLTGNVIRVDGGEDIVG